MCTMKYELETSCGDDIQEIGDFSDYIYTVGIRIKILDLYQIIVEVFFSLRLACAKNFARLLSNLHVLSIVTKLG